MLYNIKKLFDPGIYQGKHKKRRYFEGWYFKVTDENQENNLSFIPGISMGNTPGDCHAFVQVLDAGRNKSHYFEFDPSLFVFSEEQFVISVYKNTFHSKGMELLLKNNNAGYSGKLEFHDIIPYPRSALSPGIMGPFSFAPFMECKHDVINIRHRLSGSLLINGKPYDFTNGTGYIEKDWGTSFPKKWIWVQCSHFQDPSAVFMLSYAKIPFTGSTFKGLISFLRTGGGLYRMATYNGSKITHIDYEKGELSIMSENKKHAMTVTVRINPGQALKAPLKGSMTGTVIESMTSEIELCLVEKNGRILFNGKGKNTGIEIGGDYNTLFS